MPMPSKCTPRKESIARVQAISECIRHEPKTAQQIAEETGYHVHTVRFALAAMNLDRYPGEAFMLPRQIPGARLVRLTDRQHNAHDCIKAPAIRGGETWPMMIR